MRQGSQFKGLIDNRRSPMADLKSVPIQAVTMKDGFWKIRMDRNREQAIPALLEHLETHGVVDNFLRLSSNKDIVRKGPLYTDSDLYKWLEAAGYVLQVHHDPELLQHVDRISRIIEAAQEDSGYVNTWFVGERKKDRFEGVETGSHELYCAGHLIQAGIAIYRGIGDRRLLDVGIRFADYLCQVYGPGKREGFSGHPELELALIELYRETENTDYLELTRFLLEQAGYAEMTELAGHAVRAAYFACGLTDYFMETGDPLVKEVQERLWQSMVQRKSYITGGIGGRHAGESLGKSYELPNERAYSETCASIATIFWSFRMLQLEGKGRFSDYMETALYNGFLAGLSLDCDAYFYVNPLRDDGEGQKDPWWKPWRRGPHRRRKWYTTTCCPSNSVRMLASLPGYFYSTSKEGIWVHLYDENTLSWHLDDGTPLELEVGTDYPWDGTMEIRVSIPEPTEFSLFLRIPGWSKDFRVWVNGHGVAAPVKNGYVEIRREWGSDDRVSLSLTMKPVLVGCHPRVTENRESVALRRGPLVYCFEGVDNPGVPLLDVRLKCNAADITTRYEGELLEGVAALYCPGEIPIGLPDELYLPLDELEQRLNRAEDVVLKAIPYYAWANRDVSPMTVWVEKARS